MQRRLFIWILIMVSLVHCGRNTQVDQVTRALALTVRTFIGFFEDDLDNCSNFLKIYDEISEAPQTCDNGADGQFQVTKNGVTCTNGPPLNGVANFTLNQNNCQDNGTGITSTGTIEIQLNFSAAGNIGILMSTDMMAEGSTYVFDNFQTKVDFSSNNLSCSDSGDLTVDGDVCRVASNCRKCIF